MAGTKKYPNADTHERLRRSAQELIDHGVALPNHTGSLSVDALQLLYQRAKTPDSAADALKLLHELQTYQVELDLLYEQLQANEQEIADELAHYKSLYEQAPAGYLVVGHDGEIIESNQAAAKLFGESTAALVGKALSSVLAPGQADALITLLRQCREASQDATEEVVRLPDGRRLIISARSAASGDNVLMLLTEAPTPSARS